jgi:hypothetical protein
MSNVSGTISVNVEFRDTTTSSGVQSLKTVTLREATEYTSGKVAIITGTAGTSAVNLGTLGTTTYRNASGSVVSFSAVTRLAFSWSGSSERVLSEQIDTYFVLRSTAGSVAVTDVPTTNVTPELSNGLGTGTYTIVLYGPT